MSFSQQNEAMSGELQPTSLNDWRDLIGAWHRVAFPWAKLPHVMEKLKEEKVEATVAWSRMDDIAVAAELADCLICVLAAMAREGIDVDQVLSRKFEQVRAKYAAPQPDPSEQLGLFSIADR